MKNCKMILLCLILIIALPVVLTAGCSSKTDDSTVEVDTVDTTAFSFSEGIDENGFWTDVKALDYVDLFNYQAMQIPSETHQVSDDDLQLEIENVLADYSLDVEVTDRAINDGDTVNIDFTGSVDGVEFDGGSTGGQGTDVTIGVTSYIDDFLEQLIGHMPGETINVEVTFPDDYFEESLQGQDALFVTTINYIVEELTVELTDAFVVTNFFDAYGWATADEMKEGIRLNLQNSVIQQYIQQYFSTEVTVLSVPDQLIEYQKNAMLQSYQEYAEYYYSIGLEEFIATYEGFSSVDEFAEAYYDENLASATFYLVIQAVAEDAGISVSDEDLTEFFSKHFGSSDYSTYEEQFGLPYLKQVALCQKVLDYVTENAVLL